MLTKPFLNVITSVFFLILNGCFIGGGTHGQIKGYEYAIKKKDLEKTVMSIIKSDSVMFLDTSKQYIIIVDSGRNDTVLNNYYNDNINYFTLKIKQGTIVDSYIFRFYGDSVYWNSSSSSQISICYESSTEKSDVYSQSNGNSRSKEAKRLTDIFEEKIINEIDKSRRLSHKNIE